MESERVVGCASRRREAKVVFPLPAGPTRQKSIPRRFITSLDVLYLLAELFHLDLGVHHQRLHRGVLRLRRDGIELAAELLDQEIELAAVGGIQKGLLELLEVTLQPNQLLGH